MGCSCCSPVGEEVTGRICGFPRGRGGRPRGKQFFFVELQQPAALLCYDPAATHVQLRVPLQQEDSPVDAKALLRELRVKLKAAEQAIADAKR